MADDLRTALPLPPLPAGGAAEVKAAASAVRAVRRHSRARLLVAAVTTLLVGAVGGGALISALDQPNPATVHIPAQLVLAEKQLGEASLALSAKNPVKAKQLINAAAQVIQSQEGQVPTTLPPSVAKVNETATIALLTKQLQTLEAQNSRLQAALNSRPHRPTKVAGHQSAGNHVHRAIDYYDDAAANYHDGARSYDDGAPHHPDHVRPATALVATTTTQAQADDDKAGADYHPPTPRPPRGRRRPPRRRRGPRRPRHGRPHYDHLGPADQPAAAVPPGEHRPDRPAVPGHDRKAAGQSHHDHVDHHDNGAEHDLELDLDDEHLDHNEYEHDNNNDDHDHDDDYRAAHDDDQYLDNDSAGYDHHSALVATVGFESLQSRCGRVQLARC